MLASTPGAAAGSIVHGGDIDAARARFANAPEPWLDLSTGINPFAYPVPPLPSEVWHRLPQRRDEGALLQAAARRYGVADVGSIVAAPGTQVLIQLLPRLVPATDVAILGPTYQEHEACWRRAGHRVDRVGTLKDAAGAGVVVVVNPDNPTGRLVSRLDLQDVASGLAAVGGLLVVDEAFADVVPAGGCVAGALLPATVVLRSFGKTYGLAGLRLGFAVADDSMADRLREALGPWAVSGPALAVGTAALADDAWLQEMLQRLQQGAARLDAMLATAGCSHVGGTSLYRLVRHGDAWRIVDGLGRQGILVRSFAHQPDWLRFGQPGEEVQWQRLAEALRQVA